jgi:hypothetical protein
MSLITDHFGDGMDPEIERSAWSDVHEGRSMGPRKTLNIDRKSVDILLGLLLPNLFFHLLPP